MQIQHRLRYVSSILITLSLTACGQQPSVDEVTVGWQWSDERILDSVRRIRAGRDLQPSTWPDGARVAVLLSFDVDNESYYLRDGRPTIGTLSQAEYGARVGLPRILERLDRHQIPASFFIPAVTLLIQPSLAQSIQRSGRHEIGVHGWIHEVAAQLSVDDERALLKRTVDLVTEIVGERPVGHRAPDLDPSVNTIDLLLEMDFLYDASLMADDRPYEILSRGEPTGLVELPVDWVLADDALFIDPVNNPYSSPQLVLQTFIDEFDQAHEEGTIFSLTMHPDVIGHRSRITILETLIRHMVSKGDV